MKTFNFRDLLELKSLGLTLARLLPITISQEPEEELKEKRLKNFIRLSNLRSSFLNVGQPVSKDPP